MASAPPRAPLSNRRSVPDEHRVDVVVNVLAVAFLGNDKAREWASQVIAALDVYDSHERLEHPTGQMGWGDETEPDE